MAVGTTKDGRHFAYWRHHFATRALERGGDLKSLSLVMGSAPETLAHPLSACHGCLGNGHGQLNYRFDLEGDQPVD